MLMHEEQIKKNNSQYTDNEILMANNLLLSKINNKLLIIVLILVIPIIIAILLYILLYFLLPASFHLPFYLK